MQEWVAGLPSWAAAGVGAGGGFYFIKWLLEWIAGRLDKSRETIDKGTDRLIELQQAQIDRLQERLTTAEERLERCQEGHAQTQAKLNRLEATMQGLGDAKQLASLIIAREKTKEQDESRKIE